MQTLGPIVAASFAIQAYSTKRYQMFETQFSLAKDCEFWLTTPLWIRKIVGVGGSVRRKSPQLINILAAASGQKTSFEPIWESLTVREPSRIAQLLVVELGFTFDSVV